jgi:eukaryotic-like serine/threonine-protein kinase
MKLTRFRNLLFSLLACCLIVLVAACGSPTTTQNPGASPTASSNQTPTTATTPTKGGATSTPVTTTIPMPTTSTSCPAPGTARAAVIAPLALGTHQNIVYLVKQYQGTTFVGSTLRRYDVSTSNKTDIVTINGAVIDYPQISADGQWLLFVASVGQQHKLQMVRMDGKGLQTLYCTSSMSLDHVLLSSNQKLAIFSSQNPNTNQGGLYLLNLNNGTVQLELKPTNSGPPLNLNYIATPFTWLDNTRIYVSFATAPIAPINMLGILDTGRGPNQQMSDVTTVFQDQVSQTFNYPCWDADSSYDGSTLFLNQCSGISAPNCSGSCALGTREGPTTINTEPGTGGSQQTLFTSQALGIAAIRAISSSTLLLQVENFSQNQQVDRSQNGLWKLNTDGTGLTRLTTEFPGNTTSLCPFTQNPWSNVSRDGTLYAFETNTTSAYPYTYTLFYGSLRYQVPGW